MDYKSFEENLMEIKKALDGVNGDVRMLPESIRNKGANFYNVNYEFQAEINELTKNGITSEERERIINKILEKKLQSINDKKYDELIEEKKLTSPSKANSLVYKNPNNGFINIVFITTILLCLLVIILFAILN